jgi:hypothetical protein
MSVKKKNKSPMRKVAPPHYKREIAGLEIELIAARKTIAAMTDKLSSHPSTRVDELQALIKQLELDKANLISQEAYAKKNWTHWYEEAEKLGREVDAINNFRRSLKKFIGP